MMITSFSAWLTYFGTLFIVFLGVYAGVFLAFIAPEELKAGRRYFRGLMHAIAGFIVGLLIHAYFLNIYIAIMMGALTVTTLYLLPDRNLVNQLVYFAFGLAYLFSTKTETLFLLVSALIFLYGMPLGSIYVENNQKSKATILSDVFLAYATFIVVALFSNLVIMQLLKM